MTPWNTWSNMPNGKNYAKRSLAVTGLKLQVIFTTRSSPIGRTKRNVHYYTRKALQTLCMSLMAILGQTLAELIRLYIGWTSFVHFYTRGIQWHVAIDQKYLVTSLIHKHTWNDGWHRVCCSMAWPHQMIPKKEMPNNLPLALKPKPKSGCRRL